MKRREITFSLSMKIGLAIGDIFNKLERIQEPIKTVGMLHNLKESIIGETKKDKKDSEKIKEILRKNIPLLNKEIKVTNEIFGILGIKQKIKRIDENALMKIVNDRFSKIYGESDLRELGDENFRIKISNEINKTRSSIHALINYISMEDDDYFIIKSKIDRCYKRGLREALAIHSIGAYNTSIFVVGRTIEELLNRIISSRKEKILGNKRLKNIDFESKIGILKREGIIENKLFHDLNSIRIDRNRTGHPSRRKKSYDEGKLMITRAIEIIKKLQKKTLLQKKRLK